ncbi:hypothetical protein E2R66_23575 [Mucilaginibacter psychrotolerans]|uniref:Uncharacterized protein n=1 Tax=Mucilaginibacter psychrotolerans TaxID=1524096 RepID=A0A4Y8S4S4_9SPHI|nr:hypothetical protein E2R66_23575 [Mucilaginibacter psychrotolerans]
MTRWWIVVPFILLWLVPQNAYCSCFLNTLQSDSLLKQAQGAYLKHAAKGIALAKQACELAKAKKTIPEKLKD